MEAVQSANRIAGYIESEFGETAIVTGTRLFLREVRIEDVTPRYYQWMNDPEVTQYLETRFVPQSLSQIAVFVKSKDGAVNEPFFAICRRDTNEHIGNIKIGPINWLHRHADISLLIGEKSCWGKGYASEAISLVTQFGFERLGLNKLRASCYGQNEGSARAFERAGYTREGLLKGWFFSKGNESDMILLGIRAEDWRKQANLNDTTKKAHS